MIQEVDEHVMNRIRNIVFDKYELKFGKGSYHKNMAQTFQNMSVNEFTKYLNTQKHFLFSINAMMEMAEIDTDSGTAHFHFEQGNIFLELEVKENDCNAYAEIEGNEYEFTLEQQFVMQDWLEGYMDEYRQEAHDYEPDNYN